MHIYIYIHIYVSKFTVADWVMPLTRQSESPGDHEYLSRLLLLLPGSTPFTQQPGRSGVNDDGDDDDNDDDDDDDDGGGHSRRRRCATAVAAAAAAAVHT